MSNSKFVIIPPAGSGSKGDEGMMRGIINILTNAEIIILNPQDRSWLAEIADAGMSLKEERLDLEALQSYVKDGAYLIVVGADVIDGSAGIAGSLERLNAIEVALKEGGTSYSFFSFRSDTDTEIIERLKSLTSYSKCHFLLRDEESHHRFKECFPNSSCNFFPDLAFFCDADLVAHDQHSEYLGNFATPEQKLVALNFSEQSFRAQRMAYSDENRKEYVKEICKRAIEYFRFDAFLLISNDIRNWPGFWSDYDYARLAQDVLLELSPDAKVVIVDPLIGYQGIIATLTNVTALITGRMHLSIAAIRGENCIPVVVTGRSFSSTDDEKQRGMFDKARGMLQWALDRPDLVVTNYQELGSTLLDISSKYEEIKLNSYKYWQSKKKQLNSYRSNLRKALFLHDSRENLDPVLQLLKLNHSLKEQWFHTETALLEIKNESIQRGEWAKGLQESLEQRDSSIANLTEEMVKRGEWGLRLDAELEEVQSKLAAILSSNSWKYTAPLREAGRWVRSPQKRAKAYAKAFLKAAKCTYQALPLSAQTRAAHRNLLARIAPKVLLATGAITSTTSSPANALHIEKLNLATDPITGRVIVTSLPTSIEPIISIIIPVYGKIDYTLRCLGSIEANPPSASFEIIIVDDCSPDDTALALSKVSGIRYLNNPSNLGFVRSCNFGAKAAHGQYLLFLNNDTEVTPRWTEELLRTFKEFPGTGLVGSKLIYPDGRLQEAGAIIWRDGNAWNFGRFQDPTLPLYNYAREVDYCSGASVMVPSHLFSELGGFDECYVPAYCEDSDLALKIRDKGYRVIYQPLSVVIHYEGITSGTDVATGVKAYQAVNSKKLYARWKSRLQHHQALGEDVDAAKDRAATRRVLFLDHCTSTPDQDAGSLTAINTMLLLREMGFQVTFIAEDNFLYDPKYTPGLQRVGIEVLYAPYVTSVEQHLKEHGSRYDLAMLFRPLVVERHTKSIRKYCPNAKILYHTMDLHFLRMSREAALLSDKSKINAAEEMKKRELSAIQIVDAAIVHSTVEKELLEPLAPNSNIHVFPLILHVEGGSASFSQRSDIIFVGGYQHTPNIDAVKYFAHEIMPLLRARIPRVKFYVVGSKPPAEIKALASDDIIITGFVEDLTPLLNKVRVSVAPLRYGAGIKGKIGTAMAAGLPVVATVTAAEGMSLTDEENVLIAKDENEFAEAVCRLYSDESLWKHISQQSLSFAEHTWGAGAAWDVFASILSDLDLPVKRGQYPLSLYQEYKYKSVGPHPHTAKQ